MSDKNIHKLTNKELFKEFFEAISDIEKRLFRTIKHLIICPEKVIDAYIGGRKKEYLSVFRFFLLCIFFSFLAYTYFYKTSEIGGNFYTGMKNALIQNMNAIAKMKGEKVWFEMESFNAFYLEYNSVMMMLQKVFTCLSAICALPVAYIYMGKKHNLASWVVVSVFLGGITSLLWSNLIIIESFFPHDPIFFSYINQFFVFLYSWYFLYRSFGVVKRPILKALGGAILYTLILMGAYVLSGMAVTSYVKSYQPLEIKTEKL